MHFFIENVASEDNSTSEAVFVLVCAGRFLVENPSKIQLPIEAELSRFAESKRWFANRFETYIGRINNQPCYVIEVADTEIKPEFDNVWRKLRDLLVEIDSDWFSVFARANQTVNWVARSQFCGVCGGKTRRSKHDIAAVCTQCDARFYPHIAPCVIGLVIRGNQCLLSRSHRMQHGYYSTLAGFVEMGENAEESFVREVKEEVGIDITNLRYFGSQAWPFPGQLMIGFIADYLDGEIVLDENEMEDAQWYTKENMPLIPPPQTISGKIIRAFINS